MKLRLSMMLVAVAVFTACAPTYKKLPTLDRVPELEALAQRAEARRQRIWTLPVGDIDGTPYSIVAEETGAQRGDELVVLVHGLVSDRMTWQFVSGHLGETRRLWIPDQLGCGQSDRPDPTAIGESGYAPSGSARHLLEALQQRNDEAGWPERIVFVGHSLGGAVVLRILGSVELHEAYSRILERVDRAILIAPLGFAVHRADSTMVGLSRAGRSKLQMGRTSGYFAERITKELRASAENPDWVFRFDVDRVLDAFHGKAARLATQAIIRQAIPFHEATGRPDWETIEQLVADYKNVHIPVLLMWGDRDETLPLSMGYKLAAELPDAQLRIVRRGKHSLQVDRPKLVSDWIENFLAE